MLKNRFQVLRGRGVVVLGAVAALAGACGSTKTSFNNNGGAGGSGGESGWTFLPPTSASGGKSATGGNSTGGSAQAGTPATAGAGGATQVTFKCGGQKPDLTKPLDYEKAIQPEREQPESLAGSMLRVTLYPYHWLTAGLDGEIQVIAEGSRVFAPLKLDSGVNVGVYAPVERVLASGHAWKEALPLLGREPREQRAVGDDGFEKCGYVAEPVGEWRVGPGWRDVGMHGGRA